MPARQVSRELEEEEEVSDMNSCRRLRREIAGKTLVALGLARVHSLFSQLAPSIKLELGGYLFASNSASADIGFNLPFNHNIPHAHVTAVTTFCPHCVCRITLEGNAIEELTSAFY